MFTRVTSNLHASSSAGMPDCNLPVLRSRVTSLARPVQHNLPGQPVTGTAHRSSLARPCHALPPTSLQDGFKYFNLDLPQPVNPRIKKSVFLKSSTKVADCPRANFPEFAVIGRSNVGKSSLINGLAENKGLAKTSKNPGMTKLINHYLINDNWYLVDLPGYGYAKAGKSDKDEWINFTKDYFINRDNLVHVLLLVDSSLPPQPIDVECAFWLGECEVPFAIVFTKLDVQKKDMPTNVANMRAFKSLLAEEWEELPWCFATSSKTGAGKSELLGYLASLRAMASTK